jgi:OOP family OmpA-OmpF porin
MNSRALLAFPALVLLANSSIADESTDRAFAPYNAILGSYAHLDSHRDGRNGYGAASIFGFSVADGLNLEFSGFGNVVSRSSDSGNDALIGGGIDLLALKPYGDFKPFLLGGAGVDYERLGTAKQHDTYAPFIDAGVGVIDQLTQHLGLRLEARGYYVFNSSAYAGSNQQLDFRINAGLQYTYGTATAPERQQVTVVPTRPLLVPPPVAVDTDGDGIPDVSDQCPGTPLGVQVDAKGCPVGLDSDGDGVADAVDQCPGTPQGFKVDARGCIVEQIAVLRTVNFDFGSDKLTNEAKSTLDQLASSLATQPDLHVEISGHTDSLGPQAINLTLSEKRSAAVKAYLIQHGVASGRLRAEGYGEFNPVATNETEEGRALNRRVEFKVLNRRTAK